LGGDNICLDRDTWVIVNVCIKKGQKRGTRVKVKSFEDYRFSGSLYMLGYSSVVVVEHACVRICRGMGVYRVGTIDLSVGGKW
jgi:hypothetical protein